MKYEIGDEVFIRGHGGIWKVASIDEHGLPSSVSQKLEGGGAYYMNVSPGDAYGPEHFELAVVRHFTDAMDDARVERLRKRTRLTTA